MKAIKKRNLFGCVSICGPIGLKLLVFIVLLGGYVGPAFASEILAEVRIVGNSGLNLAPHLYYGEVDQTQTTIQEDPTFSVFEHLQTGAGLAGGVGHARVGLGWMQLNAFSDVTKDMFYPRSTISTYARGRFEDEMTIMPANPALIGQPGSITYAVHIDGFLDANFLSTALVDLFFNRNGFFGSEDERFYFGVGLGGYIDQTLQYTTSVGFVFGQPFTFSVGAEANANAHAHQTNDDGFASFSEADFDSTLEWGGIVRVRDGSGNLIDDYSLSSASGVDYRYAIIAPPIPEPASLAMAILSLPLFALLVGRRAGRVR